jgi:hypothetical protein
MTYYDLKNEALKLRKSGHSYSYISKLTGISKSTLSDWLTGLPYTPNKKTLEAIGKARLAANLAKNKEKQKSILKAIEEAKNEMGPLSKRDIFMLGLGVYLGEGTKGHNIIRIINANPQIIQLTIKWFQNMGLNMDNFAIRIYLYPDSDIEQSLQYWSNITKIPRSQFYNVQIDKRQNKSLKKKGKLPFGTAHLCIKSNGNKKFGAFLSRKISAWIDEVSGQVRMV